jgi:flagellar biosynthetic protein FliQ
MSRSELWSVIMEWMPQAVRDGIIVVLIVSGPLVLAAAVIGLVIGVLQAATQVQEQTIGSALKIIGVFGLIIFAGFWMYQYLSQYASRTLNSAFSFVPKQSQKAVPTGVFDEKKFNISFDEDKDIPVPQLPKAEKIEQAFPGGGAPPGVPYTGAPEVPKPPQITKLLPPSVPVNQNKIIDTQTDSSSVKEQEVIGIEPALTPSPTPTVTPLPVKNTVDQNQNLPANEVQPPVQNAPPVGIQDVIEDSPEPAQPVQDNPPQTEPPPSWLE